MKKLASPAIKAIATFIGSALVFAALALALAGVSGCAATRPPTALERMFYDITTNIEPRIVTITQTNLVNLTNQVVETHYRTNEIGVVVPLCQTNLVISQAWQTNTVTQTNLVEVPSLTPNKLTKDVAAGAGAVAAPFGWGGVVTSALLGLITTWAGIRNRQYAGRNSILQQTAGVLANNIETLRNVIQNTDQGRQLGGIIKQYLISHQNEAGVAQHVAELVENVVDEPTARDAAGQILALMRENQQAGPASLPTPTQPPTPTRVGI